MKKCICLFLLFMTIIFVWSESHITKGKYNLDDGYSYIVWYEKDDDMSNVCDILEEKYYLFGITNIIKGGPVEGRVDKKQKGRVYYREYFFITENHFKRFTSQFLAFMDYYEAWYVPCGLRHWYEIERIEQIELAKNLFVEYLWIKKEPVYEYIPGGLDNGGVEWKRKEIYKDWSITEEFGWSEHKVIK